MTWLVACEASGVVRDALIRIGVDAVSCDLKPTRSPGPHIMDDVRNHINRRWSGLIAHPECDLMANCGVRWMTEERMEEMMEAVRFYNMFCDATHIRKRAIENPVQHKYAINYTRHAARYGVRFHHPFHFGDPFQKLTGYRTYGLPELVRTHRREDYPEGTIKQEVWRMAPGPDRKDKRSETKPNTALAFARQWGSS